MKQINDVVKFGDLFELYGKLLPPSQMEVANMYFNEDLTISEIAENLNVSRQAIFDSLKKSEKKLVQIEDKVGALKIIKSLKKE
ncbi:MAG: HTH domain-containing protein [Clostridia bacterium]|nr:HTH domain-containing protein [Clostridia bacterium]